MKTEKTERLEASNTRKREMQELEQQRRCNEKPSDLEQVCVMCVCVCILNEYKYMYIYVYIQLYCRRFCAYMYVCMYMLYMYMCTMYS